jgi:hypothetical protein
MPRDIETVPDLVGFAAPNGQEGKPRTKFVAVLRDKFPKHINHSIICIGALIAPVQPFEALRLAIPLRQGYGESRSFGCNIAYRRAWCFTWF